MYILDACNAHTCAQHFLRHAQWWYVHKRPHDKVRRHTYMYTAQHAFVKTSAINHLPVTHVGQLQP